MPSFLAVGQPPMLGRIPSLMSQDEATIFSVDDVKMIPRHAWDIEGFEGMSSNCN